MKPWERTDLVGGLPPDADQRFAEQDRALALPTGLTKAQLLQESKLDPLAVSRAGARGVAQVMPATQKALEKRLGRSLNPHDFEDAMVMHRELMRENLVRFKGDVDAALKAYNNGPNPARWGNAETTNYPVLIRQRLEGLRRTLMPWQRDDIVAEPAQYPNEKRFAPPAGKPWERTDLTTE